MNTTALIPVFAGNNNTQLCNARDLHERLEVGRDFSTWIKDRIDQFGFIDGEDYLIAIFGELDSPNSGNQKHGGDRRSIDYHLTLDMAKELAMLENNAKGRMVRRYFIQAEKELRHIQQVQQNQMIEELREKASHVLPLPGVKVK